MNELELFAGAAMRKCSKCGEYKTDENFYRRGTGRQTQCIQCSKASAKEWYASNPDYRKEKARVWRTENPDYVRDYRKTNRRRIYMVESARKYGITTEQFDEMFDRQGGCCGTCQKSFDWTDKQTKPHIDHCHLTGKVRGLLCNKCNTVLGLVEDNAEVLSNLIEYLKCHG